VDGVGLVSIGTVESSRPMQKASNSRSRTTMIAMAR
jgi:hypothetical protein